MQLCKSYHYNTCTSVQDCLPTCINRPSLPTATDLFRSRPQRFAPRFETAKRVGGPEQQQLETRGFRVSARVRDPGQGVHARSRDALVPLARDFTRRQALQHARGYVEHRVYFRGDDQPGTSFPGRFRNRPAVSHFPSVRPPDDDTWPEVTTLPDYKSQFPKWKPKPWSEICPALDNDGMDLISKLLAYAPRARLSAKVGVAFPKSGDTLFYLSAGDCCPYIAIYKTDTFFFIESGRVCAQMVRRLRTRAEGLPWDGKRGGGYTRGWEEGGESSVERV